MGLVQNNASQDLDIVSVYYAGTSVISEGAVLVYDQDDTNAPVTSGFTTSNPPGLSSSQNTERNLRGHRVINPVSSGATTNPFAGVVAAGQSITGPAFVDIVVPKPGSVANVQVSSASAAKGNVLTVDTTNPSTTAIVPTQSTDVTYALLNLIIGTVMQTGTGGASTTTPDLLLVRFL